MAKTRRPPGAPASEYRRGDVLWINCDPSVGVEPKKIRTCVVVSNDLANRFGQAITVVPIQAWSDARAGRSYRVDLRAPRWTLAELRIANASMIWTCDRNRVVSRAGRLAPAALTALDAALRLHLGLREV